MLNHGYSILDFFSLAMRNAGIIIIISSLSILGQSWQLNLGTTLVSATDMYARLNHTTKLSSRIHRNERFVKSIHPPFLFHHTWYS